VESKALYHRTLQGQEQEHLELIVVGAGVGVEVLEIQEVVVLLRQQGGFNVILVSPYLRLAIPAL
jgi:hypothetical protein